ncbi:MAG: LD-carboxypeptidase [Pseudomonadota bacterium]|nr:LD-carboxypeptidase [Pseudomonadota bacterium]
MKKLALIAPSSPAPDLTPETLIQLKDIFSKWGYQIHLGSHALDSIRYLAGTDTDRAHDVMHAFCDNTIEAVMTIRGGYGSARILDLLDYGILRQNAKPFLSISDGTALQTALFSQSGITGYSGLQALFFLNPQNKELIQTGMAALNGMMPDIPIQKIWASGVAKGVAVGGNLTVFVGLIGTPYFPDMKGKILVIEDINEYPYRVDRMLAQLRLAGVLNEVAGVILGDFSGCVSKEGNDGDIDAVFRDYFGNCPVPVVQINYGHRNRETVVPIGQSVLIDTSSGIVKEVK